MFEHNRRQWNLTVAVIRVCTVNVLGSPARVVLSWQSCSSVLGLLDPEDGSINLQTVDKYLPPNMT